MKKKNYIFYLLIVFVVITISFLIARLKLTCTFETYGKIFPFQKWILARSTNGQLTASHINYKTGLREEFISSQFERGSSIRFSFHSDILKNESVSKGDTIGTIFSSELQEQLADLKGQLAIAYASLAVNSNGEKTAIVNEANQRLEYMQQKVKEQEKIFIRAKELYEKNLISQNEYELAESKKNLLALEKTIAESQLQAVKAGAKQEEIDLVQTTIEVLENEIAVLNDHMKSNTLISPISGKISRAYSSDTLMVIYDTSSYLAFIPIKLSDYSHISRTQSIQFHVTDLEEEISGQLLNINKEVHNLNGEQVLMAAVLLTDYPVDLMPGMLTTCKLHSESVAVLNYAKWIFKQLFA